MKLLNKSQEQCVTQPTLLPTAAARRAARSTAANLAKPSHDKFLCVTRVTRGTENQNRKSLTCLTCLTCFIDTTTLSYNNRLRTSSQMKSNSECKHMQTYANCSACGGLCLVPNAYWIPAKEPAKSDALWPFERWRADEKRWELLG